MSSTPTTDKPRTEPVVTSTPPVTTTTATPAATHDVHERKSPYHEDVEEKKLRSSSSLEKGQQHHEPITDPRVLDAKEEADIEETRKKRAGIWRKIRPFFLAALALLILGWWISATVLTATRHRW
jgi:CNT family concentrative nucleoside transporter